MIPEVEKILSGRSEEEKQAIKKLTLKHYERYKKDLKYLARFVEKELQPKQRNLLELIESSGAKWIGYGGSRGGAKMMPLNALISTPHGFKTHGTINVGDLINNPDGSVAKVIQVHPIQEREKITLFFHDGTSAECADDHLWLVRRANRFRKIRGERKTGAITETVQTTKTIMSWIDKAKTQKDNRQFPLIPVTNEVPFNITNKHKKNISPYLLGLLLGDGYLSKDKITITSSDVESIVYALGKDGIDYSKGIKQKTDAISFSLRGKSLKDVKNELEYYGLLNTKSATKFIPKDYKFSSVDDRYELIRGLMDTDGTVDKRGHLSFTSISKQLAEDTAFVLRSLGAVVTITKSNAGYKKDGVLIKCNDAYSLYIKHRTPEKLFNLERKKERALSGVPDLMFKRIVDYSVSEPVLMRCLTVSNPNGLYMTNDFIVTHNSGGIRRTMLLRRMKYPGSVGVIFRKTLDDLRDNHITPLFEEQPHLRQYYNVQNKELTIPIEKDGIKYFSRILFVHEDNEKTFIETFQGKNYDDIFVDEATHLSEYQLVYMATSCRTTRTDMRAKFVLSMNPGGRSHSFIKRIFIDKKYIGNENPNQYTFLQAYGWDNVQWAKLALKEDGLTEEDFYTWEENKRFDYFVERTDYGRDLNQLPDNDRKAHLFGDWFVFAGQFFPMFDEKNIIRGEYKPSEGANITGGLDYGQRTVLEVQDRDYEGNVTNFLEVYSEQKTPGERAELIADALIKNELWNLRIVYDTNMDINLRNYTGYDKTPIQIFRDVIREKFRQSGHEGKEPLFTVVSKASTNKYGYRVACNEAYKDYLNKKRFKIHESCVNLISTMPELVYDNKDGNGLDFDQNIGIDDPYDASKYALMALWTPESNYEERKVYSSYEEWMDDTVFRPIHEGTINNQDKSF